jgi:hypothetical protein
VTAIATQNGPARAIPLPEAVEKAVLTGDLSALSPRERMGFYAARCEAAGLDPRAMPFQYLTLNGKLTLYATKAATDQLIAQHRLTVAIVSRQYDEAIGCYVVQCRVAFPDGHSVEDVGVLFVAGLKGEAIANAIMKTITKSKRRTVLSACGLGMLDETEVEAIPGARRVDSAGEPLSVERPPGPALVHEDGGNEPTRVHVSEMKKFVREAITAANDRLRNQLLIDGKGDAFAPVANEFQVVNALISRWITEGGMDEKEVLGHNGKRDKARCGAVLQVEWQQHRDEMKAEIWGYLQDKAKAAAQAAGIELYPGDWPLPPALALPPDADERQAADG